MNTPARPTPRRRLISAFSFCVLLSVPAAADDLQEAIERGKEAAAACVACHQPDGNGKDNGTAESWPRLAGLNADYLVEQLHAYQDGSRESATMVAFAQMLDEQQQQDVALYYANLPPGPATPPEADEDLLKRGRTLAQEGDWERYIVPCQSCHGPNNLGIGSEFPAIAAQPAGYLRAQLEAWQNGTRQNDPLDLMGSTARRMTSHDIEAVSAWLATRPATDDASAASEAQGDAQ